MAQAKDIRDLLWEYRHTEDKARQSELDSQLVAIYEGQQRELGSLKSKLLGMSLIQIKKGQEA